MDNDPDRTLTKLYNRRPTWLEHLRRDLDLAVLDAYGWADLAETLPPHGDESDAAKQWTETLLERLLALNLERAAEEAQGIVRRPSGGAATSRPHRR